jgi:hypothetical protein
MSLITVASSDEMEITHTEEINLIGGDTRTIELLVTYTGSGIATCKITCEILPDGEGINITYIPDRFSVTSHQTMLMIINTSMLLQPDNYTMITKVSYETTEESGGYPSYHRSHGGSIVIQAVDYAEDEDSETPIDTDVDEEDLEEPYIQKQDIGFDYIAIYFICGVIIFFIIVLLVYIKEKRRKKEK